MRISDGVQTCALPICRKPGDLPSTAGAGPRRLSASRTVGAEKETVLHIEPGVVDGAKIILSYDTAAGAFGLAARLARQTIHMEARRVGDAVVRTCRYRWTPYH